MFASARRSHAIRGVRLSGWPLRPRLEGDPETGSSSAGRAGQRSWSQRRQATAAGGKRGDRVPLGLRTRVRRLWQSQVEALWQTVRGRTGCV